MGSMGADGERHAISSGCADQRRAAHQHGTDRLGRIRGACDPRDREFMRQPPLVDRADRPAVVLEPDAAKMAAVDLHVFSTLPATASSLASNLTSRASGAVINAVSSALSDPTGHGSCSRGKSLARRATSALALPAFEFSTRMISCTVTAS